jgi:hypothetical protein
MSGNPGAETIDRLTKVARDAQARSTAFVAMNRRIDELRITHAIESNLVTATVTADGSLLDLRLADRAERLDMRRLAAKVLDCVREAQATIPARVREIVADEAGPDDKLGKAVLEPYTRRYELRQASEPAPRERPAAPVDDDDYFSGDPLAGADPSPRTR